MQLADLLPVLHDLPRSDKFRALQFLTTELAQDETPGLLTGAAYPVWSPHDAVDAATVLKSTTEVRVTPDTLPHKYEKPTAPR